MTNLGMANSRMKDFYDIVVLSSQFEFDGQTLVNAFRATFGRRVTEIPKERPVAFTPTFSTDTTKRTQWTAFVRKSGIDQTADLGSTVASVVAFAEEPLAAASTAGPFMRHWRVGGGWN